MTTEKTPNYTPEQETQLQLLYQGGTTIQDLATQFGKSERSIVAKLSRMGIYQGKGRPQPGSRVTKAGLVARLGELLNLGNLETLEKADKAALVDLVAKIEALTLNQHNPHSQDNQYLKTPSCTSPQEGDTTEGDPYLLKLLD